MIPDAFLRHLRCPATGSALRLLEPEALQRVNETLLTHRVVNQLGDVVRRPLSDGLVNGDGSLLYPVWDDIPTLIPDEALPMGQFDEYWQSPH